MVVFLHCFMTMGMVYGQSASLEVNLGRLWLSFKVDDLFSLALSLMLVFGCTQTHLHYIKGQKGHSTKPDREPGLALR